MNVIDLKSRRPLIVHPEFKELAGEAAFPLWFIREVKDLLISTEVYAIASGVGLLYRLTPALLENYTELSAKNMRASPFERVPKWADGVVRSYRKHVVDSVLHEVDDIVMGFATLDKLFKRNTAAATSLARSLKIRRDDLESAAVICVMWDEQHVVKEIARVDALAVSCVVSCDTIGGYLNQRGIDRRLNTVFDMQPHKWWGVKGTL